VADVLSDERIRLENGRVIRILNPEPRLKEAIDQGGGMIEVGQAVCWSETEIVVQAIAYRKPVCICRESNKLLRISLVPVKVPRYRPQWEFPVTGWGSCCLKSVDLGPCSRCRTEGRPP
jgi:hypothetical protein